jgi:hypothetical protein
MIEIKLIINGKELSKELKLSKDFFDNKLWIELKDFHSIDARREQIDLIFDEAKFEFSTPEMIKELNELLDD